MRSLTLLATVVGLVAAAPLAAQQGPPNPPPGRPMMGRMQRGPMGQHQMPGMGRFGPAGPTGAFAPQRLLARRGQLNLTDDQVKQLEALSTELQQARAKADTALRTHHDKMMELWKAETPDANAIQREARAGMQIRDNLALSALGAAAKAKGLLTAEQRGFLQGLQEARGGVGPMGRGWRRGAARGSRMMRMPRRMMRGPGGNQDR